MEETKKCANCKTYEPITLRVRRKGKIEIWCEDCYLGFLITKEERQKS